MIHAEAEVIRDVGQRRLVQGILVEEANCFFDAAVITPFHD
jgi:hypothetical protein